MMSHDWEQFLKKAACRSGDEHLCRDGSRPLDMQDWVRWWEHDLERPIVVIEDHCPTEDGQCPRYANRPVKLTTFAPETPVDQVLDVYEQWLSERRYYGDAIPKWFPDIGSNGVAAFVGAPIVPLSIGEVTYERIDTAGIEQMHPAYNPENFWWKRIQELTRAALARWKGRVVIGHVVLGGNLDNLGAMRSAMQLLYDVIEIPEEVDRLVREITPLWLRYYGEYYELIKSNGLGTGNWAAIWSPARMYMLQSDFSFMISPQMFERFVLPDIAACCEALDHGFYHLDGKGQINHLDMLLSIKRLRGVQWIPGEGQPPTEEWLPLLKRIRDAGKLCQFGVSPEGARTIVRELGGRGLAMNILQHMSKEEANDFVCVLLMTYPPAPLPKREGEVIDQNITPRVMGVSQ